MNRSVNREVAELAEPLFAAGARHGATLALSVMIDGQPVFERYGRQPANDFQPALDIDASTPLLSWSMAKSITHAAIGMAAADGLIDVDGPAPVAEWRNTPKETITIRHLLGMRSGLSFVEDYEDGLASDCLAMLFGEGAADMAAYAASRPLIHEPGRVWNYASGTTNILCRILGDALRPVGLDITTFLQQRLFDPVGMSSATISLDPAGTFIGSSYVHATATDFARFGELYRNAGVAATTAVGAGRRILESAWTADAGVFSAADPDNGLHYGQHWWMFPGYPGSIAAVGYEGQYVIVVPERGLTLVHLGKVPAETRPALVAKLERIIAACPAAGLAVD